MKKLIKAIELCFAFVLTFSFLSACKTNIVLTINFDSNGGTKCTSITYEIGKNFNMPDDPTKENFIFDGWYEDNGTWEKPFTSNTVLNYPLSKNIEITIYAKWKSQEQNSEEQDGELKLKTVYYFSDLSLGKEVDTFLDTLTLFQPRILGKHFEGWYYDRNLTRKAPNIFTNSMITGSYDYIVLYANFVEKEVYEINILGSPKTEYEYGEPFDANGAKVLVSYVDESFEDEVVDLTQDLISNFYTTDEYFKTNFSSSYDSIEQSFSITINSCSKSVDYTVNSDIQDFSVDDSKLVFTHGESTYFKDIDVFINWTNLNGETGVTRLLETPDRKMNYYISNQAPNEKQLYFISITWYDMVGYTPNDLQVNDYGTFTAYLRYHFKTIEVSYTVLPNENIDKGRVAYNFYLNEHYSLLNSVVRLHDLKKDSDINWSIPENAIIEDIDATVPGEHFAKVLYNNKEIEISYYVIDLNEIISVECAGFYYTYALNSEPYNGFRAIFELQDGICFEEFIGSNNIKVPFDTSSLGKKYVKFTFHDIEFEAEYHVTVNGNR